MNPFISRIPESEDAANAVRRLRGRAGRNDSESAMDASIIFEFILQRSRRLNWFGGLVLGLASLALGIFLGWWVGKL